MVSVGLLRFNLFWDNTPFCTMLYVEPDFQKKGYGKKLMEHWENEMRSKGYEQPMELFLVKCLQL